MSAPQRDLVARAWVLYDEVEAERPPAGLIGRWARDLFGGEIERFLAVLDRLALHGALHKGIPYTARCLERAARGEARGATAGGDEPGMFRGRPLGQRSKSGKLEWTLRGWQLVEEAGGDPGNAPHDDQASAGAELEGPFS